MSLLMKLFIIALMVVMVLGRRLAKAWREHCHRKKLTRRIPGDEGLPVIGNLYEYRHTEIALSITVPDNARILRTKGGRILKMWLLNTLALFPLDVQMAHLARGDHQGRRVRRLRAVGRTWADIQVSRPCHSS
ncbi:hypothetical protein PENTCL1PPCAC_28740, partial [Pristionchus entomophagus]